jgi:molybdopterin-guanine dinucleotide biosynthesis protein A
VACHNGFVEPLCGIYQRGLIAQLQNHISEEKFKLAAFLENINAEFIEINESLPFYNPDLFLNVNTPDDLKKGEMLFSKNKIL